MILILSPWLFAEICGGTSPVTTTWQRGKLMTNKARKNNKNVMSSTNMCIFNQTSPSGRCPCIYNLSDWSKLALHDRGSGKRTERHHFVTRNCRCLKTFESFPQTVYIHANKNTKKETVAFGWSKAAKKMGLAAAKIQRSINNRMKEANDKKQTISNT